ncbi:L,D-transpeptidase family protein [Massilia sp. S19_KUP03_FR1]|uniref:L,D-transpeptidase family protein n=1 Tax=Massilia sp. S19_KUP03_FR1 TaxID=3025503 RepID=UPI002FCDC931
MLRERAWGRRGVLAVLLLAAQWAWCQPAPERIRLLAHNATQDTPDPSAPYDERDWLSRFYSERGYTSAWTAATTAQALDLLGRASEHGLPVSADDVRLVAVRMHANGGATVDDAPDQDAALTLVMLRYLADLQVGQVRSAFAPARTVDPVTLLGIALRNQDLAGAVDAAAPHLALYGRLKALLATYRTLALAPAAPLATVASGAALSPGAAYAGAPALAARLALLGDLAPALVDAPGDTQPGIYSATLALAVTRFQERHGLPADGKLGRQTVAALNVPLAARVRQIELSLERLRWLPDLSGAPFIAINLPSFRLWAFTNVDAAPLLASRVIVGKSVRTQTPLFTGTLRYIEFNPYWNVPPSILRSEILPALLRDPNYLVKNDMEVAGSGAQKVDAATLAALRAGTLRVRQRPGPRNALGNIEFGLPNAMNIYLHSTPARTLFARARRDFSHGCIRVEDTEALANFVLGGQQGWTSAAVAAALAPGQSRTVALKATMPVIIFYTTAMVDHDGQAMFPDDVYGFDAALERSLEERNARRKRASTQTSARMQTMLP